MKKIIAILCAFVFLFSAQVALADNDKEKENKDRVKVFATSTKRKVEKAVDIVCVQNAVEKRENAIIASFDKKSAAIKAALEQREINIKAAWAKENLKERIKARIEAWRIFKKAELAARAAYRQEIKKIWQDWKTDVRACKTNESDNESSGADNSL